MHDRDPGTNPAGQVGIQDAACPADTAGGACDNSTPGVDQHRVAVGQPGIPPPVNMAPAGRRGRKPTLCLDSSGAKQCLPMRFSSLGSERRREDNQLRAGAAQLYEQLAKTGS